MNIKQELVNNMMKGSPLTATILSNCRVEAEESGDGKVAVDVIADAPYYYETLSIERSRTKIHAALVGMLNKEFTLNFVLDESTKTA